MSRLLYLLNFPCSPGVHLEGPFISLEKKGAHPEQFLQTFRGSGGVDRLLEVYGGLDNVSMVTLAPELEGSQSVVEELSQRGITVSLGGLVAGSTRPGVRGIKNIFPTSNKQCAQPRKKKL